MIDVMNQLELADYVKESFERAIVNHEIKVYYQPVILTCDGTMCCMEALARWADPEKGMLSPGDFIPVLEKTKQITTLDLYMFTQISEEIAEARRQGLKIVPVSFNLSRIDFVQCDIFERIEAIADRYDIDRSMIRVEITESIVIEDAALLHERITQFRGAGYQVWMDDFGSGYSSLNVLKDFDFDEIKLDMAFLSTFNERSKSIIRSMITMAQEIGVHTLAEGVETKEQMEFLRGIGCEKVQGYFFSKPVPLDEIRSRWIPRG